jgi:hypothetical protein
MDHEVNRICGAIVTSVGGIEKETLSSTERCDLLRALDGDYSAPISDQMSCVLGRMLVTLAAGSQG